jgi:predicted ATP-dependent serine protease
MNAEINLGLKTEKLTRVQDILIPDVFFKRIKTNTETLDNAFGGEGFLPGMVFTVAGSPGAGKTTLLLQTLELLEANNTNTAYMSGEENIYQLAFASRRLGVKRTKISNLCVIEDIFKVVEEEKIQIVILDSFPSLQTNTGLIGVAKEKYIINFIIKEAKRLEVAVGVVLHFTKQGDYKGSTLLPHSADASLILTVNKEDDTLRDLEITKNRFGRAGTTTFPVSASGFDFSETRETKVDGARLNKKSRAEIAKDKILNLLSKQNKVTAAEIGKLLGDVGIVQRITKDLVNVGVLKKYGRGPTAYWKKNN